MDQKQKTSTSPLEIAPDESPRVQDLPKVLLKSVSYGAGFLENVSVTPGMTVADVLADGVIRDTVGYGNLKDTNTMIIVDGKQVGPEHVIKGGEQVEIIKRAGEKA